MQRNSESARAGRSRQELRERRRADRALRRRNQRFLSTTLLREPESEATRDWVARTAAGSPAVLLSVLDALPLVRYLVELTDLRPETPVVYQHGRGSPETLARLRQAALDPWAMSHFDLPPGGSPGTRRRREAVLTLLDALLEGLRARRELRFLLIWQLIGLPFVAVERHPVDPLDVGSIEFSPGLPFPVDERLPAADRR